MSNKIKIHINEAFNKKIQKNLLIDNKASGNFLALYNWQNDCYDLRDENTVLVNVPTASGKSILMRAWAAHESVTNNRKVIIAVPSKSLAIEFEDETENAKRWQSGSNKIEEFIVVNKIKNITSWFDHWETHKPKGIIKTYWRTFHMTQKECSLYIYGKSKIV